MPIKRRQIRLLAGYLLPLLIITMIGQMSWAMPISQSNDSVVVQAMADNDQFLQTGADCDDLAMSSCLGCVVCHSLLFALRDWGYLPLLERPVNLAPSAILEGPLALSFRPPIS